MNERIAIVGGGIAGLTAGYLLHGNYRITLFDKSDRLGGNAFTLRLSNGEESDIGVMAYLKQDYRNFTRILSRLGTETVSGIGTSVSFQDLDTGRGLYLTPGLRGLISQRFALFSPSRVKAIVDFLKGLKFARKLLETGDLDNLTLDQALEKIPLIHGEGKLLLIGTLCVISSMRCDDVMDCPASFFFRKLEFYRNLMPPRGLILMRYLKNRTRSYVDAMAAPFIDSVRLNARIRSVVRTGGKIVLIMEDGERAVFDKVIFACNADQALRLLDEPTKREGDLLGAWRYTEASIVVHSDATSFPKREFMPGYTILHRPGGKYMQSSINFPLWLLPGVPRDSRFMITQHQNFPIREALVDFSRVFRTPIYDFDSYRTVGELPSLNGINNTYYCGAHFGFGLHEDAVTSAVNVARMLGAEL